jgi:hypothetical protein
MSDHLFVGPICNDLRLVKSFKGRRPKNRREELELTHDEAAIMSARLIGKPVRVEHGKMGCGKVAHSWIEGNRWMVTISLDDKSAGAPGWLASFMVAKGVRGLSLKHDPNTLEPEEVSIVRAGARNNTRVEMEIDGPVPPLEEEIDANVTKVVHYKDHNVEYEGTEADRDLENELAAFCIGEERFIEATAKFTHRTRPEMSSLSDLLKTASGGPSAPAAKERTSTFIPPNTGEHRAFINKLTNGTGGGGGAAASPKKKKRAGEDTNGSKPKKAKPGIIKKPVAEKKKKKKQMKRVGKGDAGEEHEDPDEQEDEEEEEEEETATPPEDEAKTEVEDEETRFRRESGIGPNIASQMRNKGRESAAKGSSLAGMGAAPTEWLGTPAKHVAASKGKGKPARSGGVGLNINAEEEDDEDEEEEEERSDAGKESKKKTPRRLLPPSESSTSANPATAEILQQMQSRLEASDKALAKTQRKLEARERRETEAERSQLTDVLVDVLKNFHPGTKNMSREQTAQAVGQGINSKLGMTAPLVRELVSASKNANKWRNEVTQYIDTEFKNRQKQLKRNTRSLPARGGDSDEDEEEKEEEEEETGQEEQEEEERDTRQGKSRQLTKGKEQQQQQSRNGLSGKKKNQTKPKKKRRVSSDEDDEEDHHGGDDDEDDDDDTGNSNSNGEPRKPVAASRGSSDTGSGRNENEFGWRTSTKAAFSALRAHGRIPNHIINLLERNGAPRGDL